MKKIFPKMAALSLAMALIMALMGGASSVLPVYGADSNTLQALVSQAEQIDASCYTDASAALLQSAINSSMQVIQDKSASSSRVNHHIVLLNTVMQALVKKADGNTPACGHYTIKGILRQASSDNASMGNASICQPMELIVEEDGLLLQLHFTSLTVPGLGKGYLASLHYLPGWEGAFLEMTEEQYQAFQACTIDAYHEGVYDRFNHPDTGTDLTIKGQLYPKYLTLPVTYQDAELWVRVYIPIMESISAGGGTQYARLQPDWNTLTWIAPDTEGLDAAVQQLVQIQEAALAADYTQEMLNLLKQAITTGHDALDSSNIGQSQADAMAQALNAVANLYTDTEKQYLHDMIQLAHHYTTDDYTDTYVADLKKRIQTAQEVYNNAFATQTQVNEQYALLLQAISNAQKKAADPAPAPSPTPAPETPKPETPSENGSQKLDKNKLKDGVYAVTGKMVKIDKRTASMSNDAISHTVKLSVKKGKYKITLDFTGLQINGSYGYLSRLKYYKKGYTLDSYGTPQGTAKAVAIDSYQLDSSGMRIVDSYGTDYPNQVTFPLIPEAVDDGYVPLQVYIPIMEAISAGTGTQPVFLFLDWDTLKSTTEDDENFKDKQNRDPGSAAPAGSGSTGNSSLTQGNASLLQGNSSLSPKNGSLLQGNTSLSPGNTSRIGKGFSLNSSLSASLPGNGQSMLPDADAATPGLEGLLTENMPAETAPAGTAASEMQPGDASVMPSGNSTDAPSPVAVPTVMSILMAGAGFFFKLKSRGGL